MKTFDYIIIGSGQAGTPLTFNLAQKGTVALIEKNKIGGTCLNNGCIPTKTYIASARRAWDAVHGEEFGIEIPMGTKTNLKKVNERKNNLINTVKQKIGGTDNNEIAKNHSSSYGYISILVYNGCNDIGSTRTTVTRKNKSQTRTAQNTTNNNSHGRFAFQNWFGKYILKQSKQNRETYNSKDSLYQVFGSKYLKSDYQ